MAEKKSLDIDTTQDLQSFLSNDKTLSKKDLLLILEVNKKAIEVQSALTEQNEELVDKISSIDKNISVINDKIDKNIKISEESSKDLFKIQVLFISGLLSLIIQIFQLLKK